MVVAVSFGSDKITFTSFLPAPAGTAFPDDLGTFSPLQPATNVVPGCKHEPFKEVRRLHNQYPMEGVGIATNWWQSTCPPFPAALAAQASDTITVNGLDYRVIGDARPITDLAGRVTKVIFLSERQTTTA